MAKQKQGMQLILTDSKDSFTNRFQTIQRFQVNFMNDGIWNSMYTKHNGEYLSYRNDNVQPNFMNDSIRTFIHTKQPNIQTQPEQPKQRHQRGFTTNTKFMLLQLRQRKFWSIYIQN